MFLLLQVLKELRLMIVTALLGLDLLPVQDITFGLMPAVKHKSNLGYLGMFAFELDEHPEIVRALILGK